MGGGRYFRAGLAGLPSPRVEAPKYPQEPDGLMPREKWKSGAARQADKVRSLIEGESVDDYRHGDKRKDIPGSGQADYDTAPVERAEAKSSPQSVTGFGWSTGF